MCHAGVSHLPTLGGAKPLNFGGSTLLFLPEISSMVSAKALPSRPDIAANRAIILAHAEARLESVANASIGDPKHRPAWYNS